MNEPPTAGLIGFTSSDFIPLPIKSLSYRGLELTRSNLIRAIRRGDIKSRLFRQPGSLKGRRYILPESLDTYIDNCMVDAFGPSVRKRNQPAT